MYTLIVSRKQCSEDLCTLYSTSPHGNILYTCSKTLKKGRGHWYNLQKLFRLHQFLYTLCVCVVLCHFIIFLDLCIHYHRFLPSPIVTPWATPAYCILHPHAPLAQALATTDLFSSSIILSFWECSKHGTILCITFWRLAF